MERYFSYGSNLNPRDLEQWCDRMGRPCALTGVGVPAFLPDHEVVFDYLSTSRKGGVLDLRPAIGKVVPGAVFDVTEDNLRTLDLKEGVPVIYRRVESPSSGYVGLKNLTGTAGIPGCVSTTSAFCTPASGSNLRFAPIP